jgi:hypothetical protein
MLIVAVGVLVVLGVLGHLIFTAVVLGRVRTRVRDLDTGPRLAIYAMGAFWVAVAALVAALAIAQ